MTAMPPSQEKQIQQARRPKSALQTPADYTGIYANWNIDLDNGLPIGIDNATTQGDATPDDVWDFGTSSEYPVLKVDFDRNNSATVEEFGSQPRLLPTTPTSLTATAVSDTQIDLAWQPPTDEGGTPITAYQVQVSEDGVSFNDLHRTPNRTTLSYQHTGLSSGTTRHYRVAAINSVGPGDYASVSATILPAVPTSLTATAVSDTQIDLAWQPPTDDGGTPITGYQVQVSEDGSTFTDLSSTDENTLTYEQMGLDRGATYHYRIAAINSAGTGAYASVSATTHDVPDAPTGLTATEVSGTQIDLAWQPPTDDGGTPITGYQVQVSEDGSTFTLKQHR